MTKKQINEQIEAIRVVTEDACKSKESALKFLKDSGILNTINGICGIHEKLLNDDGSCPKCLEENNK